MKKQEIYLVLDNIRSVHNVGSIFRTADAIGVTKIMLLGLTPTPIDRFGNDRTDVAKVALGAEKIVPWQSYKEASEVLDEIREIGEESKGVNSHGAHIISLEQTKDSIDYGEVKIDSSQPAVLVVGNEIDGVSDELLEASDTVVEIPMRGQKESLNVSVSTGIALFELFG